MFMKLLLVILVILFVALRPVHCEAYDYDEPMEDDDLWYTWELWRVAEGEHGEINVSNTYQGHL